MSGGPGPGLGPGLGLEPGAPTEAVGGSSEASATSTRAAAERAGLGRAQVERSGNGKAHLSSLQRERGAGGDRLGRPEVPAAARLAGGPDAEAGRPEQEAGAPGECSGPLLAFPQALQELQAGQLPPAPRHCQPLSRGRCWEPIPGGTCCHPA